MYSNPYIVVLAPGRSGTTLLQKLLNTSSNVIIRGENNNFFYSFYQGYRCLTSIDHRPNVSLPHSAWYGFEFYRPEEYLNNMRQYAIHCLLGTDVQSPPLVLGFKEIRFFHRINSSKYSTVPIDELIPYLRFLEKLFPGVKFVYLDRDPSQIAQSAWWRNVERTQLIADINSFKTMLTSSGLNSLIHLKYEPIANHDVDYVKSNLFDSLDIPFDSSRVTKCLKVPLNHMKADQSPDQLATSATPSRNLSAAASEPSSLSSSSECNSLNNPRVFLDLGSNLFQGLRFFAEKLSFNSDWKVYSYEANPFVFENAHKEVESIKSQYNLSIFEHFNKAVSASTGLVQISCIRGELDPNGNLKREHDFGGSSIVKRVDDRFTTKLSSFEVDIASLDINSILENAVAGLHCPEVYIKCDIEGAEYDVLNRLLESPFLCFIKEMYVEWHSRFFGEDAPSMKQQEHNLISRLIEKGIAVHKHW
jgi:FkbM family methyltransferase